MDTPKAAQQASDAVPRPPRDEPGQSSAYSRTSVAGWVMYDFANSAFILSIVTAFFPVFFKKYWCAGHDASFSTIRLSFGTAAAGLLVAILAPVLGALADAAGSRKRFLLAFMGLGVTMSVVLATIGKGGWIAAIAVFVLANIGFSCANLFYDSLLPAVAPPERMDMISSIGYAFGYFGCALLFAVNLGMVAKPEAFGLSGSVPAVKTVFITVALWWALFTIPLLLWVREGRRPSSTSISATVRQAMVQLRGTFRDIVARRSLWVFLLAYWLYIDGVHTFIRVAADLGLSLGLHENGLLISLLIVQLVAFPSACFFGWVAQHVGAKRAIMAGIVIYLFVSLVGPLVVRTPLQFGLFAALSAVPLGALQALSRSYFARLIPAERSAEYFGFYDVMGKFAVVLGPLTVGIVVWLSRSLLGTDSALAARFGCASLSLFFVAGGILLSRVGDPSSSQKEAV